jgi:dTDP-glucose 4,6-dehydratase
MNKDIDESVKFVKDRLGHDFRYSIDSSKLDNELLFELNYPNFEDEIAKVVEYYENPTR